jgi:hypothetical protein
MQINKKSMWMIYAHGQKSKDYMLQQLEQLGYIGNVAQIGEGTFFQILAAGWQHISKLKSAGNLYSRQCFVAMWFYSSMGNFYKDGIYPAIANDCKFDCRRIDLKEHNNKICDEIISEIKRSKFLVADFSGDRGGVYFEAGFAAGLGIPVIWIVHDSWLKQVHFDTRQYNHIVYSTPEDLRFKLANRINATIT